MSPPFAQEPTDRSDGTSHPSGNGRLEALRSPTFLVLWSSEALSLVGDRLVMVALVSLVYNRTGSVGAVGALMMLKAIPALALGTLAGVFVDRWNRKRIMVISNLIQGLLVFTLPFLSGIWPIFVIYLLMAVVSQFFVPARSATVPSLVSASALPGANSLFALSIVGAMAVGPAIGSWVTLAHGFNAAFYVDALTFLVPALAVGLLVIPDHRQVCPGQRRPVLTDLREGLRHAWDEPAVWTALACIAASFFIIGTLSVCGVVVVGDLLHVETARFGTLMSALGVGMLVGAVCVIRFVRRFQPSDVSRAGLCFMALAIAAMPQSTSLGMASAFAALIGLGMILVQVSAQTVLQTSNPAMRGRLLGLSQTLSGGVTFLASALVGLTVEHIDVRAVMGGVGALILLAAAGLGGRRTNPLEHQGGD